MITKVFRTNWQSEGVGAKVKRAIGVPELRDLDPFLMLDMFKVRLPAGFPDHPHRGFETVTYMLEGKFFHEDFKGHSGTIGPGDIQWMTAGSGVVHAEMPASKEEFSIGFQLWINLPSAKKMIGAKYQEHKKENIPVYQDSSMKVVVISGKYKDVESVIKPESESHFYDIHLEANSTFEHTVPLGWNALVFPYSSLPLSVNNKTIEPEHAVVLKGQQESFKVFNGSTSLAKFIVLFGKPLNEPIAKHGPFVMNTHDQIQKTFADYQQGKNGFENAGTWESKIQELAHK